MLDTKDFKLYAQFRAKFVHNLFKTLVASLARLDYFSKLIYIQNPYSKRH